MCKHLRTRYRHYVLHRVTERNTPHSTSRFSNFPLLEPTRVKINHWFSGVTVIKFLRRYSITERNTSAMEPETVPDTHDYILWDKIGKSIGVYSGVYGYTQQIPGTNTEYTEYTRYLGICCALQAGFLQCNWFLRCSTTETKTTVTRKRNPCRAARSLALPLEAGRTLQTVLREGQSTLVPKTHPP